MDQTVYSKLAAVQKELKAPKNQYNSFGKYKYRSAEDILEASKPLCIDNGLVLTVSDKIEAVSDRVYVCATATVTDTERPESQASCTAYAREPDDKKGMDGSQITGTASSYARKYALNGLFCIDDTKDTDTDEYSAASKQRSKSAADTRQQAVVACPVCGEVVKPTKGKDGTIWSPDQVISKCGGMCVACYNRSKTEVRK